MAAYLRFSLNGVRYAVDARAVLEIVRLAELSLAAEAPSHIAGLVNLRGRVVPVMNLEARLGRPSRPYRLSDSIVMLESQSSIMGIIVNHVSDVVDIADAAIEALPDYDGEAPAHTHFLAGNAKIGEEIVMLLDISRLFHAPETEGVVQAIEQQYFCPDATEQERAIFLERARGLMQPIGEQKNLAALPLSVIQLGGEHFGVELQIVREFSHLLRVTPVPCCPPHIVGDMNIRGDILTLVDIRGLLNVSSEGEATAVMVVESDELQVGLSVEQVLEVIYRQASDIVPLPAAAHEEKGEYCKGAVHHGDSMISILDMQKILTQGGLEVEQEA